MNLENPNTDDFLKGLTNKKNPFKTPDNYFNKLSDKVTVDIFEESLPNKTGYKAPNHYFENFTVKKPQNPIIRLLPYISTAAVIIFGFFIFNQNNSSYFNDLTDEEILEYLSMDEEVNTNFVINNANINTHNIVFTDIESLDIDTEDLEMELSEYDILEY